MQKIDFPKPCLPFLAQISFKSPDWEILTTDWEISQMTIIKGYFGILENSEDLIAHLEDSLPSQNSQEMPEMLAATRNC